MNLSKEDILFICIALITAIILGYTLSLDDNSVNNVPGFAEHIVMFM